MKVKFYILQKHTETGKTREKYLFTEEREEMFIDKQIDYEDTKYQVKSLQWKYQAKPLEWEGRVAGVLKAVCLVVPGPNTH